MSANRPRIARAAPRWPATLAIIVAVLAAALPVLTYPLGRDQGEFAVLARGMLAGRAPYTELWNPKPPAVFLTYAAALAAFGHTPEAVRAIDFSFYPAVALLLVGLGAQWGGRARVGLWAALVFGVVYFRETFWTLTQNDGLALVPLVAMAWLVWQGDGPRRGVRWLAAGACLGAAFWFKYPFVLIGAALFAWHAVGRWPRGVLAVARDALAFALGAAVVFALGAAGLAAAGALGTWWESARVTSAYTALGFSPAAFADAMRTGLETRAAAWGVLAVLAAFGVWAAGKTGVRRARSFALVWLAASAGVMLVQAKGYDYHWLPMLAPLVLLAAVGVVAVLDAPWSARIGQARVHGAAAAAGVAVLAVSVWPAAWPYLTGAESRVAYDGRFIAGEFDAGESRRVALLLREQVVPGDSLTIWGFRPEIYFLSGLNPATRFIFHFPLVGAWYPPEWRDEHAAVLWAAMPPRVIVAQADWMPWVTGIDADSNTLLQQYPALNAWLMANYQPQTQIGNLFIWERRPIAD
jgi:hypothetical protein